MSSWQVLQVSAPTYSEGSVGRTYFCACSCLPLLDFWEGLPVSSFASVATVATRTHPSASGRSKDTRPRKETIGFSFPDSILAKPDQIKLSSRLDDSNRPVCDARHLPS